MARHFRYGKPAAAWETARLPLLRTCPMCGAGPNQSCVRTIAAKVAGQDIGGSYTKRLKKVHDERRGGS